MSAAWRAAGAAGLVLALAGLALASPLSAAAPISSVPEGLSLTANPVSGAAPLKVLFDLSASNGSPPELRWAFGDGNFLNGTGSADHAPYHTYLEAGEFHCQVTAVWPRGSVNASISIDVSANLTVAVTATPVAGLAPLTVWLNGSVGGGSGTLVAYDWTFGDGGNGSGLSVRYTYTTVGNFTATLTVTDSGNRTASGSVRIAVRSPPPTPRSTPPSADPISLTTPLVGALAVTGAGAVLVAGFWVRRTRAWSASGGVRPPPTPSIVAPPPPAGPPAPEGPAPPPEALAPIAVGPREPSPTIDPPASTGPAAAAVRSDIPLPSVGRPATLTLQILRHLAGLPRLSPEEAVAPAEFTQSGMAEVLGAGQSAVSRVLRRLEAAGVIEVTTRHVAGSDRRLRVYVLTDRGERLGRALRESPELGRSAPGPREPREP